MRITQSVWWRHTSYAYVCVYSPTSQQTSKSRFSVGPLVARRRHCAIGQLSRETSRSHCAVSFKRVDDQFRRNHTIGLGLSHLRTWHITVGFFDSKYTIGSIHVSRWSFMLNHNRRNQRNATQEALKICIYKQVKVITVQNTVTRRHLRTTNVRYNRSVRRHLQNLNRSLIAQFARTTRRKEGIHTSFDRRGLHTSGLRHACTRQIKLSTWAK